MPEHGKIEVYIDAEIRDLIPEFLAYREKEVALLREATAGEDYQQIRNMAHRISGAGGLYGFAMICELGIKIGEAACEQDAQRLAELVDSLEEYLSKVEVKFK